jgi:hypothetical protein
LVPRAALADAQLSEGKDMRTIRLGMMLLCALPVLAVSAKAADDPTIEPGQWKTTSNTVINGAAGAPAVKARCFTPEQAGDVTKTFGPVSGTINSTCAPTVFETTAKTMKWHLQCKGQLDLDIQGNFNFDSPSHYTATISSKGWMAGALMSDVKTEVEGERVGECQP